MVFLFARHGETLFNLMGKIQGWCDTPLTGEGIYAAFKLGEGLADVDLVAAYSSDSGRAVQTRNIALEARENVRRRFNRHTIDSSISSNQSYPDLTFSDRPYPRSALDEQALNFLRADSTDFHSPHLPVSSDVRLREWCYGFLEGELGIKLRDVLFECFGRDLTRAEQNERLPEIADYLASVDPTGRAESFSVICERLMSFLDETSEKIEARGGGTVLVITHAFLIRTLVYLFDRERINEPLKIENASITEVIADGHDYRIKRIGDDAHLKRKAADGSYLFGQETNGATRTI